MTYDFDRVIDRRATESNKWHKYPADVLPLWVADMDFRSPEPVHPRAPRARRARRVRLRRGAAGVLRGHPATASQKRYGWRVPREAILLIPGVIPGFNLAARAFTSERRRTSSPDRPCTRRSGACPKTSSSRRTRLELTRGPDGRYTIDFDRFEAAIGKRTRMFLLCNPHNPVGRVFTTG